MSWPIPRPADIAERAKAAFEVELARVWALLNPGAPPAIVDARSPTSSMAIHADVLALSAFDVWLFIKRQSRELMPTSAVDWLPYHGQMWGVARVLATPFAAPATFTGAAGTNIPALTALAAPGGVSLPYVTTSSGTIAPGATTVAVPIACAVAGSAGTLPTSTVLTVVSPIAGLSPQTGAIGAGGTPGEDDEDFEAWRGRIVARIRQRGLGGNAADFIQWAQEVYPTALVYPTTPAVGLITVAFAMPSGGTWRAPTTGEVATMSAYLNDASQRKPLGAPVVSVVGAIIQPVAVTLHLNPDTVVTEAAATAALARFFLADATIAGTILVERMDVSIANSSGEFSHIRAAPSADVTAGASTLSVLGAVTFT
jgi:uncharacterized phage protein gp47/JayE